MSFVQFVVEPKGTFHEFGTEKEYIIDHDKSFEEIKEQYKKIINDVKHSLFIYTITSNNEDEDKMIKLADYLLNIGTDINGPEGEVEYIIDRPLAAAMEEPSNGKFRTKIIKWLIDNGASVTKNDGLPHILRACEINDLSIIKTMVEKGANIKDLSEDNEDNVLTLAMFKNYSFDVIKYLVDNGADVNYRIPYGSSVLMIACIYCDVQVVKYLIDNSADIHARDKYGLTPLAYAIEAGNKSVVKFIKEYIDKKTDERTNS